MFSLLSLREKFVAVTIFITFCLITIFHSLTSYVIHKNYNQLEKELVVERIKKTLATFDAQLKNLDNLAQEWANWDNTFHFFTDYNEDVDLNIFEDAFVNNDKVDLMLIFNAKKGLINVTILNQKNDLLRNIKPVLLSSISVHSHLFNPSTQTGSMRGIVKLDNRYLLIAAKPIYDSVDNKSVRGILVFGNIIDGEWTDRLETITRTSISFHSIFGGPPDAVNAAQALLLSSSPYHVSALSEERIKGYTFLNDISGEAILVLAIDLKRELYLHFHETISFLLTTIIVISIFFGLIFFVFIDVIISRRLKKIISDIEEIEKGSKPGARVTESRLKDELSLLAVSINHMLNAKETLEEYKAKGKKLEALTTFSAGATHELATPLSAIAVASGEILYDLANKNINKDDLYDDIFLIREQVDRCRFVLNQMAEDAGQQLGEKVVSFSTATLIDETLVTFDQETCARLEVNNKITDQLIAMPFQSICRVLHGLIRNSIEASESEQFIFIYCSENTTHLLLEIRDNGTGMDEDTFKHALEPFFTTKSPSENLGLGLYLAQSIVSRFGGDLQLSSTPDVGTTVILSFAKEHIYV